MLGIGEFFKKIRNAQTREILIRSDIQKAIHGATGVDIPIESILIKIREISLKGISSDIKSVIYIKKTTLLKQINLIPGLERIIDIN